MDLISVAQKIRKNGILGSVRKVQRRLAPERASAFHKHLNRFDGRRGIEMGGPTPWAFGRRGLIPIYPRVGELDNVNYAANTIWEGSITSGNTFRFDARKTPGVQLIAEITDLSAIPSGTYDFLISSHVLEHSANPIKAILEWKRVVRPGGLLLILLPDKERTFDHHRPVTTLEHMIEDFRADRDEDDLTHLDESTELHDYSMTPEISDPIAFRARGLKNLENRCLHHHTFTQDSLNELLRFVNLEIIEHSAQQASLCALTGVDRAPTSDLLRSRQ